MLWSVHARPLLAFLPSSATAHVVGARALVAQTHLHERGRRQADGPVAGEPVLAVASEAGGGAVAVGIGGEVAAGARPEAAVPGGRRHDALRLARREGRKKQPPARTGWPVLGTVAGHTGNGHRLNTTPSVPTTKALINQQRRAHISIYPINHDDTSNLRVPP
jgi:hypothetical protein